METLVLHGKSKEYLKLLANLAKQLGIKAKHLIKEEAKEMAMGKVIETGMTGEYIDTDAFLNKLRK